MRQVEGCGRPRRIYQLGSSYKTRHKTSCSMALFAHKAAQGADEAIAV